MAGVMPEDYRWLRNGSLSTLHPARVRVHAQQCEGPHRNVFRCGEFCDR